MIAALCIDTYLPREGTETGVFHHLQNFGMPYSSLSTSRGDGNLVHFQKIVEYDTSEYSYLSTSRGAGNLYSSSVEIALAWYSYLSTSRGDSFIREKDSKSK